MNENNKIQKQDYFSNFEGNLKSLKKSAKRKKTQFYLKNFSKFLDHYHVLTYIKFQPKVFVNYEEILQYFQRFNDNLDPEKEYKIVKLQPLRLKNSENHFFFSKNDIVLFHHLSIPVKHNFNLNFDTTLTTKNEYLFSSCDIYSNFRISDFDLKV